MRVRVFGRRRVVALGDDAVDDLVRLEGLLDSLLVDANGFDVLACGSRVVEEGVRWLPDVANVVLDALRALAVFEEAARAK